MSAANAQLGRLWLKAFNAHDVHALVQLYAVDATHTSPKIRALHPESGGKLHGHAALKAWWSDAISRLPKLRYEELTVTANEDRVFLEYMRDAGDGNPERVERGGEDVPDFVHGR